MSTTIIPEVQDIVDNAEERELYIVSKEMERPPYYHEGKGGDTRLTRALRLCLDDKITPNSDGSYTVEGSEHRTYRVTESCSCPQSQKGASRWCYHAVAVALYVEWQRRLKPLAPTFSPVALGTLRAGTAPLPQTYGAHQAAKALGPAPVPDDEETFNGYPVDDETLPLALGPASVEERLAMGTMRDATALSTHHTPQEDRMSDYDDSAYIPEPDNVLTTATAVADAPVPPRALTPVAQEDDLEQALTHWTAQRQVVQRFLKQELKANIDYYTLRIGGKDSKPSLSKAGAEKVMGWLKLQASFAPDTGTWEMLGRPTDLVCFVCTLRTRSGEIVGEGRGARSIKKDGGDVNKAIKMAEKSANVSAVLRTGCLSDVFTSDLEDMQEPEPAKPMAPAKPSSQDLRARIWTIVQERAPQVRTRESSEAWVKEQTGLPLHPDHYADILRRLEVAL